MLYQIDIAHVSPNAALQEFKNHFKVKKESWSFAEELVNGIGKCMKEIDLLIEGQSEHWKLGRMSLTDRNILRLAVYELLHMDGIPSKVTINEAIELGKLYGTDESGAFINGILDKVFKNRGAGEKKAL